MWLDLQKAYVKEGELLIKSLSQQNQCFVSVLALGQASHLSAEGKNNLVHVHRIK